MNLKIIHMHPVITVHLLFVCLLVSPAQKEDNFCIKPKIYQWLTSHHIIATWLYLGAKIPLLNGSSPQNCIYCLILSEKNQKRTFAIVLLTFSFVPELFYLYTYVHVIIV